jgi:hypothetical protein
MRSLRTATELPPSGKPCSRVSPRISAFKPARRTYTYLIRYMKDSYYISWRTSTLMFHHFGINKHVRPDLKPSRRRKRGLRIWTCSFRCCCLCCSHLLRCTTHFQGTPGMLMSALHLHRTAGDDLNRVMLYEIMHDT